MTKFHVMDMTKEDEYVYEFECARQLDENTFVVVRKFSNPQLAEEYAKGFDCVILHNVRVQGKVKKVSKNS